MNFLVITCEHAGREVPQAYAALFSGREALLASHRGWDAGALELGCQMADAFGAPRYFASTTRLLVDLNRSIGHRQLFSEVTRALPRARRQCIVDRYYWPHRQAIEGEIARQIAQGHRVIHVASHSFTPMLDGVPRQADVAWLYDPRRLGEAAFAQAWMLAFAKLAPELTSSKKLPVPGARRRTHGIAAQAPYGRGLRRDRARGQSALCRSGRRRLGTAENDARRFAGEGACRHCGTLRLLRSRRREIYHCSGGSSWKTLRVPSSQCCVSASK